MKKLNQSQRGLSLILSMVLLIFGGISVLLGIRLIPVYFQYYNITSAIHGLEGTLTAEQHLTPATARQLLKSHLMKQLQINEVRDVPADTFKVKIVEQGYEFYVDYSVTRKLFANVDLLIKFNKVILVPK